MLRKRLLIVTIMLIVALIGACVPIWVETAPASSTQTAFNRMVNGTITARFIQQGTSGGALPTALANATALSGTITAQALLDNASYPATATAIFPILDELPKYGISPLDGNVAWLHRPITITLNGLNQYGYANDYPQVTAGDFVLASDITWNTNYGLSGCGFMFRSDGNKAGPNQLLVMITRTAEGMLAYSAMAGGMITNYVDYFPWVKDKSFNWQNDSTNRLVVVARGKMVYIYTNGTLISELDTTAPPPTTVSAPSIPTLSVDLSAQQKQDYQTLMREFQNQNNQIFTQLVEAQRNYNSNKTPPLLDGFLSFAASSSSGNTQCAFSNAWLFLLNRLPTSTPTYSGTGGYNVTLETMAPTTGLLSTAQFTPTNTFVFNSQPTAAPTAVPTEAPTAAPTEAPTSAPTDASTEAPTSPPATEAPTSSG